MTKRLVNLAAAAAILSLTACSRPTPPPTPQSSADKAEASAPNGRGPKREELPDPVNDGKPTAATAKQDATRPPGS